MKIDINDIRKSFKDGYDGDVFDLTMEKLEEFEDRISKIEDKLEKGELSAVNPQTEK